MPYCVTSPTVPSKITFAGQEIDLLRYDHRERMDRELMSFTYMHSTNMFRLLAAKAVVSNPQQYGFLLKREHLYPPIPYKETTVTTSIENLAAFALNKGDGLYYNPQKTVPHNRNWVINANQ